MSSSLSTSLAIIEPCLISSTGLTHLLKDSFPYLSIYAHFNAQINLDSTIVLIGPSYDAPMSLEIARSIIAQFATKNIRRPRILVFSSHAVAPLFQTDALHSGVMGCIQLPIQDKDLFFNQINRVIDGQILFDMADIVVSQTITKPSERELEILRLVAQLKSNRSIADELHITMRTVDKHICNIIQKLQVTSRHEAVLRACHLGWL